MILELNLKRARVKANGRYGILNVDLTCGFCCAFKFSCLVLQQDVVWGGACPLPSIKFLKNESK